MKHLFTRRILTLLAFLVLMTFSALAQQDSTIALIAYWGKGDEATYDITKTTITIRNDSVKQDTSLFTIHLTVLDSTDVSYEVEWKYEKVLTDLSGALTNDINLGDEYGELVVDYKTDELGIYEGITNLDDIQEYYSKILSDVALVYSITDSSTNYESFENALNLFNNREAIEGLFLKEINYFHWPYGFELSINDTLSYEDEIPSAITNSTIRADGYLYFDTIDFEDQIFVLVNELYLDQKDSKRMVQEYLNSLTKALELDDKKSRKNIKGINKLIDEASLDIYEYNSFRYDYYYGYPLYIYGYKETEFILETDTTIRKDIIEIELK